MLSSEDKWDFPGAGVGGSREASPWRWQGAEAGGNTAHVGDCQEPVQRSTEESGRSRPRLEIFVFILSNEKTLRKDNGEENGKHRGWSGVGRQNECSPL